MLTWLRENFRVLAIIFLVVCAIVVVSQSGIFQTKPTNDLEKLRCDPALILTYQLKAGEDNVARFQLISKAGQAFQCEIPTGSYNILDGCKLDPADNTRFSLTGGSFTLKGDPSEVVSATITCNDSIMGSPDLADKKILTRTGPPSPP